MPRVKCNATSCIHYCSGKKCGYKGTIEVYIDGCGKYEKGVIGYIHDVWETLGNSNMIPMNKLTDNVRIGIYYVMKIYHIGFYECEYGMWEYITLGNEEKHAMTKDEITALKFDMNELQKLIEDFNENGVPKLNKVEVKVEEQPFGWLSPAGDFTEGAWGSHERLAEKIISNKGWLIEYDEWCEISELETFLAGDFLSEEKGYALIHDPSNMSYIVTHIKPLTKKQKDFLYGYFLDMGMTRKAEKYLED